MEYLLLGGASQADIPEDHAPPASADRFALLLLQGREVATLALPVLNKGLQTHRWPELLKILDIREGFRIADKLHHVSAKIGRCGQDQLGDEHGALVLEKLLLIRRIVHVVHIDRHIDVEWLK